MRGKPWEKASSQRGGLRKEEKPRGWGAAVVVEEVEEGGAARAWSAAGDYVGNDNYLKSNRKPEKRPRKWAGVHTDTNAEKAGWTIDSGNEPKPNARGYPSSSQEGRGLRAFGTRRHLATGGSRPMHSSRCVK